VQPMDFRSLASGIQNTIRGRKVRRSTENDEKSNATACAEHRIGYKERSMCRDAYT